MSILLDINANTQQKYNDKNQQDANKPSHVLAYERIIALEGGTSRLFSFDRSHDEKVTLEDEKRPSCNTVAQNTNLAPDQLEMRFLVDWFQGTAKLPVSLDDLLEMFQVDRSELLEHDKGMLGYKRKYTVGEMIFLEEGTGKNADQMGVHFILSGSACREFEQKIDGDWIGFTEALTAMGVTFSRTDAAMDDFGGILDMEVLRKKIALGEVTTYFNEPYEMTQHNVKAARQMNIRIRKKQMVGEEMNWEESEFFYRAMGIHTGHTIYFGSAKSRMRYRIYDKFEQMRGILAYEEKREKPNQKKIETIRKELAGRKSWIRVEAQMRDERADRFWGTLIARQKSFAEVCCGALLNYIRFVDVNENDLDNPSRWETSEFWSKLIGGASRTPLTMGESVRTYEKTVRTVEDKWSATVATYFQGHDDLERAVARLMEIGEKKQTDKHFAQLDPEKLAEQMMKKRERFLKYKQEWDLKRLVAENRSEEKRSEVTHMTFKQVLRDARRLAKYGTDEQKLKFHSIMNYQLLLEERGIEPKE